ncbi:MAG: rhodanese-like domain-containing protein [Pseudomonadota bacterium]
MKQHLTRTITVAGILATLIFSSSAFADLAKKKQTPQGLYLTAVEAHDFVKKNNKETVFIDVRTRAEVGFLGMPTVADANIPYALSGDWGLWDEKKQTFKLAPNSNFLPAVEKLMAKKGLDKESNIVVMCRSGSRSAKAAKLLDEAGYKNVYSITDGYEGGKAKKGPNKGQRVVNGWKNAQLPWSYKLDKEKMYWEM